MPIGRWRSSHNLAAIAEPCGDAPGERRLHFPLDAKIYQIERQDICTGLRGANVRVEQRLDGRWRCALAERYLRVKECAQRPKVSACQSRPKTKAHIKPAQAERWNKNFDLKKGAENLASGARVRGQTRGLL